MAVLLALDPKIYICAYIAGTLPGPASTVYTVLTKYCQIAKISDGGELNTAAQNLRDPSDVKMEVLTGLPLRE